MHISLRRSEMSPKSEILQDRGLVLKVQCLTMEWKKSVAKEAFQTWVFNYELWKNERMLFITLQCRTERKILCIGSSWKRIQLNESSHFKVSLGFSQVHPKTCIERVGMLKGFFPPVPTIQIVKGPETLTNQCNPACKSLLCTCSAEGQMLKLLCNIPSNISHSITIYAFLVGDLLTMIHIPCSCSVEWWGRQRGILLIDA